MFYPVVIMAIENSEDRDFMMRLYDEYHRIMCAQAYEVLQDHQYVEDVISEACLALIEKIEILTQLECPALRAYIVSTIRNTALNFVKRLSRQRKRTLDDPDLAFETIADEKAQVDSGILLNDEVERVTRAILQLPESEQKVMQMKFYDNMSNDEIALNLGVKAESVRKYIVRARRHILEILG